MFRVFVFLPQGWGLGTPKFSFLRSHEHGEDGPAEDWR